MNDTPEVIRQQMEDTKSQLSEKLESLEHQVSETVQSTGTAVTATAEAVQETVEAVTEAVHDAVHAAGGSISAEHGLGVLRRDESARYKAPLELRLMQSIKRAFDPHNLMNPGKLLGPFPPHHQELTETS